MESKQRQLFLDIETYSSAPLPKCGVYRYCDSPDFQILLLSYAFDDGPVKLVDLASGEDLPEEFLQALEAPDTLKLAHNAAFERVCFSKLLGHWLDPHQWRCSMVWASYLTLPASLADAAVALHVTEKKMEEGKELIRYFSMPCKPTKSNGGRERNLPHHAPDKWAVYKQYNIQDVEAERAVVRALEAYPMPESEWELYALDQTINDRGVRVDKRLVKQAMRIDAAFSEAAYQRAKELTGLENPGSVSQLKAWLADQDMPMESLAKRIVQEKAANTDGIVGDLLNLRLELSKTSVKKYESIARCVCGDGRVHGTLQFYGANRTGRWSGRLVQMQNLAQNHLPDLNLAREIVKRGDIELLEMTYGSVPNTLSELIRTAFIPKDGCRLIVTDFSAIEARVLAWLAGEDWVLDEFRGKGKIYEATASRMYHIPQETIVKGHPNYEYRQKGKQATLSCIAEGQLVLTNHGLIPIERVKKTDLLWDGEMWVRHDGVIERGKREVITYEGLTATADHLVWVKGQSRPIHFGLAAASGAHLIQTGNGGTPIRMGQDHQPGKTLERKMESLLCADRMHFLSPGAMEHTGRFDSRSIKRLSELFSAQANSEMARSQVDCREISLRESKRSAISFIRWQRDQILFSFGFTSGTMDHEKCSECEPGKRNGSNRQQWQLYAGQHSIHPTSGEFRESPVNCFIRVGSGVLAVLQKCSNKDAFSGKNKRTDYRISAGSSTNETKKLENHRRTARLYDIRNAGPHHRFTVSDHLVHNCGYGGGVGALKAMGAKMPEEEMQPLVDAWRAANPHIVAIWRAMDRAARTVVEKHTSARVGKIRLYWKDGKMFMRLPSERELCYLSPRIVENRFGNSSIGFMNALKGGKMTLQETWGATLVENATQATARDLLANGMKNLEGRGYRIVFHVHDECVMEVPEGFGSVEEACEIMSIQPDWARDLPLRADGAEMVYYQKF